MPEQPLRVGILGCGRIAGAFAEPNQPRPTTHAAALIAHGGFRLDAVYDPNASRAHAFATRWGGAAVADDPAALAARGLDVVAICTPDATHTEMLRTVLAQQGAPRLILMEKPLCTRREDLDDLAGALARRPDVAIAVNHSRRFDAGHTAVRDLIASGRLGEVKGVRWVYYGGWMHNGVHAVDTLRWLLGGNLAPAWVERGWEDRPGDPCLDGRFVASAWPQARVLIESHPEDAFQLFEGEIRLTEGRIRLLDFGAEIIVDEVRTNAIGERELKHSMPLRLDDGPSPMQTLYAVVHRHLTAGDGDLLARAGLDEASATMRILFDTAARLHP